MPRIPRGEMVGGIYHIINRGKMKMQVFDAIKKGYLQKGSMTMTTLPSVNDCIK